MALSQPVVDYTLLRQPSCAHVDTLLRRGVYVTFYQRLCACFTHTQRSIRIAGMVFLTNA